MENESNDRGSPDGGHSGSTSSHSVSRDSALPTTPTLHSGDLEDDDDTDETLVPTPSRSKSTEGRMSRLSSATQPFTTTSTSVDRFKHGIRYLTDGFIRKISKQNNLTRIHTLNLSNLRDKKIRYIENLQALTNLENLDLSNNLIEKIDGLKSLKKLKYLSLSNNFINTIINLDDLSQLENLNLDQNQIQLIPIWFGKKLMKLKVLNLANNQILAFDQIARLRSLYELRELYLQGNPIDQNEHYRLLVISYVPSLQTLDGIDVSEDERKQAKEQYGFHKIRLDWG
jgi:dynein light chain 1